MNAHAEFQFSFYGKNVFRNFATLAPSQNLMDDLISSPAKQKLLGSIFYDHAEHKQKLPVERVMQQSMRQIIQAEIDKKFTPGAWYESRYSDGSWPVLYAAESQETALAEVVFHLKEFYKEEITVRPVTVDRRVVKLKLHSKYCVDLAKQKEINKAKLVSPLKQSYSYCQAIAKKGIEFGAEILRAPSARDAKGFCTAILTRAVIKKDFGHLKYLKIVLTATSVTCFSELPG